MKLTSAFVLLALRGVVQYAAASAATVTVLENIGTTTVKYTLGANDPAFTANAEEDDDDDDEPVLSAIPTSMPRASSGVIPSADPSAPVVAVSSAPSRIGSELNASARNARSSSGPIPTRPVRGPGSLPFPYMDEPDGFKPPVKAGASSSTARRPAPPGGRGPSIPTSGSAPVEPARPTLAPPLTPSAPPPASPPAGEPSSPLGRVDPSAVPSDVPSNPLATPSPNTPESSAFANPSPTPSDLSDSVPAPTGTPSNPPVAPVSPSGAPVVSPPGASNTGPSASGTSSSQSAPPSADPDVPSTPTDSPSNSLAAPVPTDVPSNPPAAPSNPSAAPVVTPVDPTNPLSSPSGVPTNNPATAQDPSATPSDPVAAPSSTSNPASSGATAVSTDPTVTPSSTIHASAPSGPSDTPSNPPAAPSKPLGAASSPSDAPTVPSVVPSAVPPATPLNTLAAAEAARGPSVRPTVAPFVPDASRSPYELNDSFIPDIEAAVRTAVAPIVSDAAQVLNRPINTVANELENAVFAYKMSRPAIPFITPSIKTPTLIAAKSVGAAVIRPTPPSIPAAIPAVGAPGLDSSPSIGVSSAVGPSPAPVPPVERPASAAPSAGQNSRPDAPKAPKSPIEPAVPVASQLSQGVDASDASGSSQFPGKPAAPGASGASGASPTDRPSVPPSVAEPPTIVTPNAREGSPTAVGLNNSQPPKAPTAPLVSGGSNSSEVDASVAFGLSQSTAAAPVSENKSSAKAIQTQSMPVAQGPPDTDVSAASGASSPSTPSSNGKTTVSGTTDSSKRPHLPPITEIFHGKYSMDDTLLSDVVNEFDNEFRDILSPLTPNSAKSPLVPLPPVAPGKSQLVGLKPSGPAITTALSEGPKSTATDAPAVVKAPPTSPSNSGSGTIPPSVSGPGQSAASGAENSTPSKLGDPSIPAASQAQGAATTSASAVSNALGAITPSGPSNVAALNSTNGVAPSPVKPLESKSAPATSDSPLVSGSPSSKFTPPTKATASAAGAPNAAVSSPPSVNIIVVPGAPQIPETAATNGVPDASPKGSMPKTPVNPLSPSVPPSNDKPGTTDSSKRPPLPPISHIFHGKYAMDDTLLSEVASEFKGDTLNPFIPFSAKAPHVQLRPVTLRKPSPLAPTSNKPGPAGAGRPPLFRPDSSRTPTPHILPHPITGTDRPVAPDTSRRLPPSGSQRAHHVPAQPFPAPPKVPVRPPVSPGQPSSDSDCMYILSNSMELYRAYNSQKEDHLYTTDRFEMDAARSKGYRFEGITGLLSKEWQQGFLPLFHLRHPTAVDQLYTSDPKEKDRAIKKLGYKLHNIVGYVFDDGVVSSCGAVPLYQMYHAEKRDHFYSTSLAETRDAVRRMGYTQQGVVGYVLPPRKKHPSGKSNFIGIAGMDRLGRLGMGI
ncbi:hypothetical protein HGRIS_008478 [Hohenbuehelia grisea]|uniref:DUF5648 domain-containing protein n=1 Tax=Hohenbuehelia grisea TaxID=104357 RepID=A0ABR3J830_9AGAR